MNRRTKIIVSVAGIFIVLLALLGLTYGYFLTRINGNSNTKSIDITTANLELTYNDGSDGVIGEGQTIEPGFTATKTFTVTNNGNDTSYVVVFENVVNNFQRQEDLKYVVECTSNKESSCNGANNFFPNTTDVSIIVGNEIVSGETQTYKITVEYAETGVNQSMDMNKKLSAKINIASERSINKYAKGTLAYEIINNALTNKNGTQFRATPITFPAREVTDKYDSVAEEIGDTTMSVTTTYQGYYWTYGTGYEIDEDNGDFTITGVSTCKYNEGNCAQNLVGKYLMSNSASSNSNSVNTPKTHSGSLWSIYKVVDAPVNSSSTVNVKLKSVEGKIISAENTLSVTADDYGNSYYYRGGVKDNYLELNNICFRIVRIQGDGSIKLTLANEGLCSASSSNSGLINNAETNTVYGYDYDDENGKYIFNYEGYAGTNGMYKKLNTWYSSKMASVQGKLKRETWCLGGKTTKYDEETKELITDEEILNRLEQDGSYWYQYETGKRLIGIGSGPYDNSQNIATYKCSSEADISTSYIGALTADEMAFAGGAYEYTSMTFYLYDNAQKSYWSLSRAYSWGDDGDGSDGAFELYSGTLFSYNYVNYAYYGVRPAVTLASGAEFASGDGTKTNPYKIK